MFLSHLDRYLLLGPYRRGAGLGTGYGGLGISAVSDQLKANRTSLSQQVRLQLSSDPRTACPAPLSYTNYSPSSRVFKAESRTRAYTTFPPPHTPCSHIHPPYTDTAHKPHRPQTHHPHPQPPNRLPPPPPADMSALRAFPLPSRAPTWYIGHMAKSMREFPALLRDIDIVIEARDARVPLSGVNGGLEGMVRRSWGLPGTGYGFGTGSGSAGRMGVSTWGGG